MLPIALICLLTTDGPDLERAPINYAKAPANNPVARLGEELVKRKKKLTSDERFGFLPAVLSALDVPVSSQVLVFSKTSLQQRVISPKKPRAIYFNDDVYIGYCQDGEVLEVAAADANIGTAFYTLYQMRPNPSSRGSKTIACSVMAGQPPAGFPGTSFAHFMLMAVDILITEPALIAPSLQAHLWNAGVDGM